MPGDFKSYSTKAFTTKKKKSKFKNSTVYNNIKNLEKLGINL